jgi:hypothetical protein
LGSKNKTLAFFSVDIWSAHEKVSFKENKSHTAPFTLEEIKSVVFQMNPNKAHGSDDFSILFYQTYWDLIKDDLVSMFHALICLISKTKDVHSVKYFRPINLLNYSFKIFSKILTNHL